MDLGVSGLASGFDWKSLVSQLINVERVPQQRLLVEKGTILDRKNAYGSLQTQLSVLRTRVTALKETSLYGARQAVVADATVATATAGTDAPTGTYTFKFTQLATAASQQGGTGAGKALSLTDDVSGLVVGEAGLTVPITAGIFTVNGKQVSISTTDTLQQVFEKISTATSGAVTGSYSAAEDKITLASASPVVLGSVTDTSNFLQVSKLYNNGGSNITSTSRLGGVKLTASVATANLSQIVSDGGAGAGEFKINGVSISFSASSDSVQDVLDRINGSGAGVLATYDAHSNRFVLTNTSTGDVGMALEDVTGNFLAATQLSSGTLQRGKNLLYTVNDGDPLVSQSNTITGASSGLSGLSVVALKEGGSTAITVSSDTSKVKTAINDFITEYNKMQSLVDTLTASSTNSSGKVTAASLAGESDAYEVASQLRKIAGAQVSGLSSTFTRLEHLGIVSNGNDNSLSLADSEKLDDALASNLRGVQALFADSTYGLAIQFDTYLEATVGDEGTLLTKQANLGRESTNIDTQISDMERLVQSHQEQLTNSFIAMEGIQAKVNQQLTFLKQRFGS
jgi:flagellar hook-associated protein 2